MRIVKTILKIILKTVSLALQGALTVGFLAIALGILGAFILGTDGGHKTTQVNAANHGFSQRYEIFVNNTLSDALDGVLSIKKVYRLNDDDIVAPEPDQACFGTAQDPAQLQWLLDEAADLLDGQDTLFTVDTPIYPKGGIRYYLDDTILVITWKQILGDAVYVISEVKIADPSQFRRFLADGDYAAGTKYFPSEMATSVNAVVAANGDFYSFRNVGIIVYDSQLMRASGRALDTCFIAGNGDLLFAHRGQMTDKAQMEQFIEDNGVRFSVSFGPVLIENGEVVPIKHPYEVGEGNIPYARMALCQRDELHYYLVSVTEEPPYDGPHTLPQFQECVAQLGCKQAYNLDGGQSGTIVMNDQVVNYVWQRRVSDIIYFATAIPDGD